MAVKGVKARQLRVATGYVGQPTSTAADRPTYRVSIGLCVAIERSTEPQVDWIDQQSHDVGHSPPAQNSKWPFLAHHNPGRLGLLARGASETALVAEARKARDVGLSSGLSDVFDRPVTSSLFR